MYIEQGWNIKIFTLIGNVTFLPLFKIFECMSYSCNEIVKLISNWAIVRAFGIVWKGNCYYHTDAAAM